MPLEILLLGPPQILEDGQPPSKARVLRRRERAALYFLAANTSPVSRDRLLNLLWGLDADPTKITNALSVTLSRLRHFLPKDAFRRTNTGYELVTHPDVFIDYRAFCDVCHHDLPRARRIPPEEPLGASLAASLQRALSLWRGEFLEGFAPPKGTPAEYDDWIITTANYLETHYLALLSRLAQHAFASQDYPQAFGLASKALERYPGQPEMLLLALRALRWQGLTKRASDFLRTMRERYLEVTGQDYDSETLHLAQDLLTRRKFNKAKEENTPWKERQALKTPFVGRKDLLDDLERRAKQGGVALVLGDAGQGKTRLLQEFIQRVREDHRVVTAVCHHGESALPFAPLLGAFRRQVNPEEWSQVPEPWWPYLLHLFPEAKKYLPYVPLERPPAPLQSQLMEVLRQILLVMSREAPLVLCVDDAQWSDAATVDALLYFMERGPFERDGDFMLITARREAFRESPLGERLLPLIQEGHIASVELDGLRKDEVAALAESVLARRLDKEETESLWKATVAGTPLYVLEMLRHQLETGNAERPVSEWPLAHRLVTLLEQRLDQLSDDERLVLSYAALQESGFPWQVLKEAAGLDEERLVAALEGLEARGWIQRNDQQRGRILYTFVHDKLREVVDRHISPLRRQSIHGKLAQAWEKVLDDAAQSRAAIIARHYQEAGEARRAFRWWILSAHHALELGVARQAHDAFYHAERVLFQEDAIAGFDIHDIWALYAEWMLLAADTVDFATLEHIEQSLLRLAELRRSPVLRSSALNAKAHALRLRDRLSEALSRTQEALRWLKSVPNSALPQVEVCTHHATLLYLQGRIGESIECLNKALEIAQDLDSPLAPLFLGSVYYQRAVADTLSFRPDKGLEEANKALQAYHASRRVFGVADALGIRSLALFMLGRYEEALADCQEARERAVLFNKRRMLGYLYAYCAFPMGAMGRWKEAWDAAQQALALGVEQQHKATLGIALRIMGGMFFILEDWYTALAYYYESLQYSEGLFLRSDLLFRIGITFARLGDLDLADEFLGRAIEQQKAAIHRVCPLARLSQAEVLIYRGRIKEAFAILHTVLPEAQQNGRQEVVCGVYYQEARAYLAEGQLTQAQRAARRLVQASARIGYVWLEMQGLELLQQMNELTHAETQRLKHLYEYIFSITSHPHLGPAARQFLVKRGLLSEDEAAQMAEEAPPAVQEGA